MILFTVFGTDLLMVLGYVANLVALPVANIEGYAFLIVSLIYFASLCLLYQVPFVLVGEQVSS